MGKNETSNGKKGGLLKGKAHYNENGKPLGGIKAIVTDTNTPVELEGGEVIINKHASKKYWKELSKINQSAGNGVPIKNPNGGDDEDPEEYKDGGRIIDFNPNHLPNKKILTYAKKIKSEYPKVWDLGGNIFGNEAFKNLQRVSERGYWLESEKWMYIKWRSFVARHTHDFRIKGVIAMLKWVDKVDKGWDYMKNLIEAEIEKKYPSKMEKGGKVGSIVEAKPKTYSYNEYNLEISERYLTDWQMDRWVQKGHTKEQIDRDIATAKKEIKNVEEKTPYTTWHLELPKGKYEFKIGNSTYNIIKKIEDVRDMGWKSKNWKKTIYEIVKSDDVFSPFDEYILQRMKNVETKEGIENLLNNYFKNTIQENIDAKYLPIQENKMEQGGQVVTYRNKFNKRYGFGLNDSHSLEEVAELTKIKLSSLQDIYDKGIGAYKTNPESVRPNVKSKEQWAMARVYSAVMGGKASKVDANELSRGKISKETKMKKGGKVKNIIKSDYSNNNDVSEENAEMVRNQNKQILHHTEELKKALDSGVQVPAWVVAKINRATNDMSDATHYLDGTLRYAYGGDIKGGQVYDWNKYGVENTIAVTDVKDEMVFYRLNGVPKVRGMKEFVKFLEEHNLKAGFQFKQGGELEMGIKEEKEHIEIAKDLYKRKITPSQSAEKIAKDHLKEDPNYYSKLKSNGFMYGGALVESKDKVDMDMKSDIFVNSIIFKSELDYVLGGFNVEALNRIVVKNNLSAISLPKLETIFSDRLELAIEDFKDEIRTNLLKSNEMIDSMEIESDLADELNNLFETYLGFSHYSTNTKEILESIKRDTTYMTWMGRIEKGLKEFTSMLKYSGSDVNYQEQSKISVKEAEELTTNSTFEQMLEKLFYINQENTI